MLKTPLFWKILTLITCILLLLIPLHMLRNLIDERSNYRNDVERILSRSTSDSQTLLGPIIVVPVSWETVVKNDEGQPVTKVSSSHRYYLPEELVVTGKQAVETRHIGIYDGQIWRSLMKISATFNKQRLSLPDNAIIGKPRIVLAVGDSRGIGQIGEMLLNQQALMVEPGSTLPGHSNKHGVHADIDIAMLQNDSLKLEFSLDLLGTHQLSVIPLGRNSQFSLSSDWPHPNFQGNFLPYKREISAQGFDASWRSSWFANNLNEVFENSKSINIKALPAFRVTVVNPVDHYQLSDRAIKYALLLISLTFIAFFVFEMLTSLRVHAMQYLLVGASLVTFYLVLLALSEHIGFNFAWIVASLVCAGLNGYYLQAVFKSGKTGWLFSVGLLALYGVLWMLLQSEDNALLLGAGVLLTTLAVVMGVTRHFDWYSLSLPGSVSRSKDDPERFRLWK